MMVRTAIWTLALGVWMVGTANAQSDLVKRGDYLVNGILTCGNCHSPKGPPAAIAGKDFSGGLSCDEPPFKLTAPNITPDKETGIGTWTDAQIETLMRPAFVERVHVAMIMPTGYHIMTDRDLDAVVAYLRTLKPVSSSRRSDLQDATARDCGSRGRKEVHRRHDE
jgi:mono/diheme cytochrome c family protein